MSPRQRRRDGPAALAVALFAALVGCASPAPPPRGGREAARPVAAGDAADAVAPNANLVAQGIPPVPRSVFEQAARYADFRGHAFVDWHPTRAEMLVSHRRAGGDTVQLFRVAAPLAEPEPLTDFADPVRNASYAPISGDYIVFERSSGGDEAAQLFRLDLAGRALTQISEPGQRHNLAGWLHASERLLYLSLPLDRTATGGSRSEVTQTLTLVDPLKPEQRRRLAELPGGGWDVGGVSRDDRRAVLTRYLSATESQVWLLDLASGQRSQVLPALGEALKATHFAAAWKHDGSGFFFVSDRDGDFHELMFYRLADRVVTPVTRGIPWDVADVGLSADGRLLAVQVNVDGKGELRFFDAELFNELPSPALAAGSVVSARFHERLPLLAFAVSGAQGPSRIGVMSPATGAVAGWTRPATPPGIDTAAYGEQRVVRWKSFDGREISGMLSLPPPTFAGRRPVLIDIHGGPESQARFGFLGRYQYFVQELGVAVLQPNVRGSSGFGKRFVSLDDGMKREDSVKDIGALLDWIATQPQLDASRVVVSGGSYGGYMSLAVATHYADRIAGAIDVVGISDFASFLKNTESYRRDLRRVEYGDERDPAFAEFFARVSPLANADRIKRPLFVVHGRNDPRVPYTEAEQIVARVRAAGTTVWYLRAENEGHGFARKENADYQFGATVMFLRETLLK